MKTPEAQYRRALRWYPRAWRTANEEVVLGMLLDAEDDASSDLRVRATRRRVQIANLSVHAVLSRLGLAVPGFARHALSTYGLSAGTAFALVYFWFHSRTPLAPSVPDFTEPGWFGSFENSGVVLTALWVVAFVSSMLGQNRITHAVLWTAFAATCALPIAAAVGGPAWSAPSTTNLALLSGLNLVAVLGTPRSRTKVGAWSLIWLTGFLAVYAINGRPAEADDRYLWQSLVAGAPAIVVVGAVVVMGLAIRLCARPEWAAVAFIAVAPWLLAWTVASTEGNIGALGVVGIGTSAALCLTLLILRLITVAGIRVSVGRRRP
jgi:hypothetical protein